MNQPGNHLRICLAALSLLLGPLALRADAPAPLPATAAPADLPRLYAVLRDMAGLPSA